MLCRACIPLFGFCTILVLATSCTGRKGDPALLFKQVPASTTHIDFENALTQTAHFNIIEYLYFYNGGGVSAGDINNDGLVDLYFTANQLQNKLYLNRGNFLFEDITARAGVAGEGNWKTGTTMADVNGDGLLDIFVCGVGNYKLFNGKNQLFINNGDLTFTDATQAYGLAFQGLSTHAAFLDYDRDGDLDMYLVNHSVHTIRSHGNSRLRHESDSLAGDRLYRNEIIPHGRNSFTDVTAEAGIYNSPVGYGLSVGVSDLNLDGYPDIYVSNDFHENDYLYINQRGRTFRETVAASMPHTSRFSMGNDIADINNDGYADILTLDMLPRDEQVIKTTAGEDPYDIYSYKLSFGYHHQFARNALQLNRGVDDEGNLLFSDIAPLAGLEATDWSWAPLLADFDNDGHKDAFIANGIVTRPNDLDYMNFIATDSAQRFYGYDEFIRNMPPGKVPNFLFRNEGNLKFRDVSNEWIGSETSVSTGAVYADLDNDGDLDIVVNNVNEKASIMRNDTQGSHGWLQIELDGEGANRFGIGARVVVYGDNMSVHAEQFLSRGWQSSVSPVLHMGIGDMVSIDSVSVTWPNGKRQALRSVSKNVRIKVHQSDAGDIRDYPKGSLSTPALFAARKALPFTHRENDFNAFNTEKLIPHMLSTQGPPVATGDLNADGLEDFFIGGAVGQSGQVFFQMKDGEFVSRPQPALQADSSHEDTGSAIFDADGDGNGDLVVVSGGQQFSGEDARLRPRIYLNNGAGMLRKADGYLPEIYANASCVQKHDFDRDGDDDLFIGGRVITGQYGISAQSYLLSNDGKGHFTDESWRLKGLAGNNKLGLVTDARWADLNDDNRSDLVVVGEWMPITVMIQDEKGIFSDRTNAYGLEKTNGWWNALHEADFDNDGDMDFVAGNLGWNSRLRATAEAPVALYVGDMDDNGGIDHLLTYYNNNKQYPFISRDQLVQQSPSFKRKFLRYNNFKNVKREDIIPAAGLEEFTIKEAFCFSSVYLENRKGKFSLVSLPVNAQMFPVFAFASGDFNDDGKIDVLVAGNLLAVQPDLGRYDAGYGVVLTGDGRGNFEPLPIQKSGFLIKGEVRSLQRIGLQGRADGYLVGRNNDSLLLFQ